MYRNELHTHEVTDEKGEVHQFRICRLDFPSGTTAYGWYGLGQYSDYEEAYPHATVAEAEEEIRKCVAGEEIDVIAGLLGSGMIVHS